MKGSLWTMWEKAGNDFDQAALLSDLLRASGYQTRFVIGTVEVEPEYMQMVLGVNSTEEALQLLWENYVPAELSNKKILVEHVWVEVKLPYGMYSDECYRGYITNRQACGNAPEQWIPIKNYHSNSFILGILRLCSFALTLASTARTFSTLIFSFSAACEGESSSSYSA